MNGILVYMFSSLSERIGKRLRLDLFVEIMKKDVEFFDTRKTGDLISRLQSDTQKVQDALSRQLQMMTKSSLECVLCLGVFLYISWRMTLLTVGIMLPMMIFTPFYGFYI